MNARGFGLAVLIAVSMPVAVARTQTPDDERRAAITVMRAINTAEHAVRQSGGRYVGLEELLAHQAMGRVRANIAANGNSIMHQGAQVRLALAADGSGYQVMVVPVATCGTAVFSDERGLIYTGKVLDC